METGACLVVDRVIGRVLGPTRKEASGLSWPAPSSSSPPLLEGDLRSKRSRSASPSFLLAVVGLVDGSSKGWNRNSTPFFGVSRNLCLGDCISF